MSTPKTVRKSFHCCVSQVWLSNGKRQSKDTDETDTEHILEDELLFKPAVSTADLKTD